MRFPLCQESPGNVRVRHIITVFQASRDTPNCKYCKPMFYHLPFGYPTVHKRRRVIIRLVMQFYAYIPGSECRAGSDK